MVNVFAPIEMNLKANRTEVVQMVSTVALQQKTCWAWILEADKNLDFTTYGADFIETVGK